MKVRNKVIEQKRIRHHSLIGRIDMRMMFKAFKNVKRNRGTAGIDKVSIQMYESRLGSNLQALMKQLKEGTYQPKPLKRVYIPKGDGSECRPLGIPAVRERVAQDVLRQLIEPLYEPNFHQSSYGFRPERNCIQAVEQVKQHMQEGYKWIVDADIKSFFDNISHDLIMEAIRAEISDGKVLSLVLKFLRAKVMTEGKLYPTKRGTPQGGVISPLLANIILNHLDRKMQKQGLKFVRYADDFVILSKTKAEAQQALEFVSKRLEELELTLHERKTRIVKAKQGFDFLGFRITSRWITIRNSSTKKFKDKVRHITKRSRNLDDTVIERLNQVIRGTVNYFCQWFTSVYEHFRKIDQWIRSRLRCMKYKRKWDTDNCRLHNKHIENRGLISAEKLCKSM